MRGRALNLRGGRVLGAVGVCIWRGKLGEHAAAARGAAGRDEVLESEAPRKTAEAPKKGSAFKRAPQRHNVPLRSARAEAELEEKDLWRRRLLELEEARPGQPGQGNG